MKANIEGVKKQPS